MRGGSPDGLEVRPAGRRGRLTPAARAELETAQQYVSGRLRPTSPHLADVLTRLLEDHVVNENTLGLTTRLLDPQRRSPAMDIVVSLVDGAPAVTNPGYGPLFEPVEVAVNSRKNAYVAALKAADPARAVGPVPTADQTTLVAAYQRRLAHEVYPVVEQEVDSIAGADSRVSGRVKGTAAVFEKVGRMVAGGPGRAPRPDYRVGDVIDAVGMRITAPDMRSLADVFARVKEHFGTGDAGRVLSIAGARVLEIENMYASPKVSKPLYRVISMVIAVEVNGQAYTFELQLTTDRASVAADIEHNTLFKSYVAVNAEEADTVMSVMEAAAALDHLEAARDA